MSKIEVAPFVNVAGSHEAARLSLAYYVGGMGDYYNAALRRLGFSTEAEAIRQLWQSGRRRDAIRAVTDEMVDAIAICGPLENCLYHLDEMYASGASLPIVPIPAEGSTMDKCRWIESLME
jgi:hypothetical protein